MGMLGLLVGFHLRAFMVVVRASLRIRDRFEEEVYSFEIEILFPLSFLGCGTYMGQSSGKYETNWTP